MTRLLSPPAVRAMTPSAACPPRLTPRSLPPFLRLCPQAMPPVPARPAQAWTAAAAQRDAPSGAAAAVKDLTGRGLIRTSRPVKVQHVRRDESGQIVALVTTLE